MITSRESNDRQTFAFRAGENIIRARVRRTRRFIGTRTRSNVARAIKNEINKEYSSLSGVTSTSTKILYGRWFLNLNTKTQSMLFLRTSD